jgi:hypothetical protein
MFAAAATYWLFGGGGGGRFVFVNLWLSQYVKIPETTRAMIKAVVSRRLITRHPYAT